MTTEQPVTLENLANGGAVELWEHELQRVLQNIADANTNPTTVRQLTLKVSIKPTEERTAAAIAVEVTSKLAGSKPITSTLYMGRKDGRLVAVSYDPRQADIFKPSSDVVPLEQAKGATR